MPTTRPTPAFESIDIAALASVQGGCGKKQQACTCAPQAIAVAAAPPPAAPPRPASVETNVSVSYQ